MRKLYNTLVKDGYDMGTFEEFKMAMSNPTRVKNLYNTLVKDGYDMGTLDEFKSSLSSSGSSSSSLPSWVPECLKTLNPKKKNDNVISFKNSKGNTLYFSKSGKFQYVFTSKPGEPNQVGKWKCDGNSKYTVLMDNGDKWDGTKWVSKPSNSSTGNNEYQPKENGVYTTKGDPYQYKIVDGEWYVKSWKNRGKIIQNWVSLKNNQTATEILDGRFPGVRKPKGEETTQDTKIVDTTLVPKVSDEYEDVDVPEADDIINNN